MSCGVLSAKFVDIRSGEHHFPSTVDSIGFPVTLLHNHSHAPAGYYLVYRSDFILAEYLPREQAEKAVPCSWFMEDGKVLPYQFTENPMDFDLSVIQDCLSRLQALGFHHYGTTVRPVRNYMELETNRGHIYVPMEKFKPEQGGRVSETVTNGIENDGCWIKCYEVSTGHGTYHSFDP